MSCIVCCAQVRLDGKFHHADRSGHLHNDDLGHQDDGPLREQQEQTTDHHCQRVMFI